MPPSDRNFLHRWARRKRESAKRTPVDTGSATKPTASATELPALESLTFESDFAAFMRANVEESLKRAALRKLLHDPRFNVMDGLDTYIDDYTKSDPISAAMLETLEHARSTLFGPKQRSDEPSVEETASAPEENVPAEDSPRGPRSAFRRRAQTQVTDRRKSHRSTYVPKLSPHPQVWRAFGLSKRRRRARPSCTISSAEP